MTPKCLWVCYLVQQTIGHVVFHDVKKSDDCDKNRVDLLQGGRRLSQIRLGDWIQQKWKMDKSLT
jgi:hypothetical protein